MFLNEKDTNTSENMCDYIKKPSTTTLNKEVIKILQETLNTGVPISLNVISQSMSPLLKTDDTVIVEKVNRENYKPGDIIVFENHSSLVTHRLLVKKENHWLTKGDNAIRLDPPLNPGLVLGKVTVIQSKNHRKKIQTPAWLQTNTTITKISLWQTRLVTFVDQTLSKLCGEKKIRGVSVVYKILVSPFKLTIKLLIAHGSKNLEHSSEKR